MIIRLLAIFAAPRNFTAPGWDVVPSLGHDALQIFLPVMNQPLTELQKPYTVDTATQDRSGGAEACRQFGPTNAA
jgi:hypothetical protein